MDNADLVIIPLLSLVGLLLMAERWWRGRLWHRSEERLAQHVDALARANRDLARQVQAQRQRRGELERIVLRLSDALQEHDLGPEERKLLSDVYHEYGTEGHAYHFGGESGSHAHK
jgi:hypothetical protein